MCGRSALSLSKSEIQCACSYKHKGVNTYIKPQWLPEHNDGKDYSPSFNIVPSDVTPVLVSGTKYRNAVKTSRVLKPMMWGIIPPWQKSDYKNHNISTNNCRIENITNSKLYGPILKNGGRCVIVVEGYYEWQTTNKATKTKQPYYVYAQQRAGVQVDDSKTWNNTYDDEDGWKGIKLLHMAGLYNIWENDDQIIYAYSVITMESNDKINWLHHRMPAVLDTDELIEAWLDIDNVPSYTALSLLKQVNILCWYRVSTLVNNSRYKENNCNKRIPEDKKDIKIQKTLNSWLTKRDRKQDDDNYQSVPAKKQKR
ncbi:unnamed protein product [Diatraea saccharalis]|uniref:Abasic site processing protein HMCES n=1 Tax=Diatraea saccharalis TaxID=40085 RepID=A0A9P0C743_9NEOP|nr:unnamed protein product [Diatraea saccharalis]